jgi:hypothetical protein
MSRYVLLNSQAWVIRPSLDSAVLKKSTRRDG